jgi:hypothetical protein
VLSDAFAAQQTYKEQLAEYLTEDMLEQIEFRCVTKRCAPFLLNDWMTSLF